MTSELLPEKEKGKECPVLAPSKQQNMKSLQVNEAWLTLDIQTLGRQKEGEKFGLPEILLT